ncbi:hypothetical protein ACWEPZ_13470 [Streptomyces sp. NPDC004288]
MRQLGNAAHLLHIRPWEWDLMTVEQADAALDWLDSYKASMDEAEEKMRRG